MDYEAQEWMWSFLEDDSASRRSLSYAFYLHNQPSPLDDAATAPGITNVSSGPQFVPMSTQISSVIAAPAEPASVDMNEVQTNEVQGIFAINRYPASMPLEMQAQRSDDSQLPGTSQAPTSSNAYSQDGTSSEQLLGAIYRVHGTDTMIICCQLPGCHRSFARWPDFTRHYNGAHAFSKDVHWCPSVGCVRSEGVGDNPFPRKDKMLVHARQVHGLHVRGR